MTHRHEFRVTNTSRPEIGRERVRQACHRCRLKKLKCDGIVPCGRCIKDDMLCQHRERKGTGIEQTHSEYVSRLEEQQRILATALKLTWTRLHPDEAGQMPSAHEIIMRLRLMPPDATATHIRRDSADDAAANASDMRLTMPSPPDSSQGQLESSAQSSSVSTPAVTQQPMLLSYDFGSTVHQADIQHVLNTFPEFMAKSSPLDWSTGCGQLQDDHFGPDHHDETASVVHLGRSATGESSSTSLKAPSGGGGDSGVADDFATVEPWQLMLDDEQL